MNGCWKVPGVFYIFISMRKLHNTVASYTPFAVARKRVNADFTVTIVPAVAALVVYKEVV